MTRLTELFAVSKFTHGSVCPPRVEEVSFFQCLLKSKLLCGLCRACCQVNFLNQRLYLVRVEFTFS